MPQVTQHRIDSLAFSRFIGNNFPSKDSQPLYIKMRSAQYNVTCLDFLIIRLFGNIVQIA